jgi:hypothetical protein
MSDCVRGRRGGGEQAVTKRDGEACPHSTTMLRRKRLDQLIEHF